MKQEVLEIFKSKDAPFLITVAGLVVLYGIKRVTETNYQFTASTKDGEDFDQSQPGTLYSG